MVLRTQKNMIGRYSSKLSLIRSSAALRLTVFCQIYMHSSMMPNMQAGTPCPSPMLRNGLSGMRWCSSGSLAPFWTLCIGEFLFVREEYNIIKYITVLSSIYVKTWKYTARYPCHYVRSLRAIREVVNACVVRATTNISKC